jgi:phage terminase small subunit
MSQNVVFDELTYRQKQGVQALLTSRTQAEAAEAIGARRRTLQRWLKQPAFAAALQEAQQQQLEQASRALQDALAEAVGSLTALMSEDNTPAVRLRAAEAVLRQALAFADAIDMAQRLANIEERLNNADIAPNYQG